MAALCAVALVGCDEARRDPSLTPATPEVRDLVHVSIADEAAAAASSAGVDLVTLVDDSVARVVHRLDVSPTPVSVRLRPRRDIPGGALRGRTNPATGDVVISLYARGRDLEKALEVWLPPLLAHELHHAERIVDGPGYGDSLTEAIVTEGLAVVFSLEVFPETPTPSWARALPRGSVCRWWDRATRRGTGYDHARWFYGSEDIPRWAGYSIGFALVRRYLERHPSRTAADLAAVPAQGIIEGAGFSGREHGRAGGHCSPMRDP